MTHTPRCTSCNAICARIGRRDAYYCPACDDWRDAVCYDPECKICVERPEKPSQAKRAEVR